MKLPYKKRAFIPPEKIINYLLSTSHERGKHKARVFQSIGFNITNRNLFENSLLRIAHIGDVINFENAEKNGIYYGKKYKIIGNITGPNGDMRVSTVWVILVNKRKTSLVTVTPL
jgi:hypothetical protein